MVHRYQITTQLPDFLSAIQITMQLMDYLANGHIHHLNTGHVRLPNAYCSPILSVPCFVLLFAEGADEKVFFCMKISGMIDHILKEGKS